MSKQAPPNGRKHIHAVLPFGDWARLKKMLIDRGEGLSPFIRRVIAAELDQSRAEKSDRRASA